jgi:hypothetical protein
MITWTPAPEPERFAQLGGYLAAAFLLLVMGVGGAIWLVNRRAGTDGQGAGSRSDDQTVLSGLAQLEQMDIRDPISELDKGPPPERFELKSTDTDVADRAPR